MALNISWRDGRGNPVTETLNIDPGNSAGKVKETLTAPLNQGLDRTLNLEVTTITGQKAQLTVNQEGCREAYITSDGLRYVTSDGQVYGLLKNPLPCPCMPADKTTIAASYITLNQNLTDPAQMITGDINGPAIRWIRCNSHRVLGKKTAEGVMAVCRLDDSNSNYFHDGAEADLTGGQGDVFMRLPQFYYHAEEIETDVWKIGFSPNQEASDWKVWDGNDLIGVYKMSIKDDSTYMYQYSVSGKTPRVNVSHADAKEYMENRGTGYSLVKFKHHSMMAFLFYAMYGNTDCQAICGAGTSTVDKITGATDILGMTDTVAGGNGDSGSINFWGLENWWGDMNEWVDSVSINNHLWTITEDDGSTRQVQAGTSDGYISKVYVGNNLDMVPVAVGASNSTGFCDYYYQASVNALVFVRSGYDSVTSGGVAYANAVNSASFSNTGVSSRLAFRGTINEIESSTEFMAIENEFADSPSII